MINTLMLRNLQSLKVKTVNYVTFFYFPIQNFENTLPSISSLDI